MAENENIIWKLLISFITITGLDTKIILVLGNKIRLEVENGNSIWLFEIQIKLMLQNISLKTYFVAFSSANNPGLFNNPHKSYSLLNTCILVCHKCCSKKEVYKIMMYLTIQVLLLYNVLYYIFNYTTITIVFISLTEINQRRFQIILFKGCIQF